MEDSEQIATFYRIDKLIGQYYKRCGINDYFNEYTQYGRFMQYIIDEELDDDDIKLEDELNDDTMPSQCVYTEFDMHNFPINNVTCKDDQHKRKLIFYIIQYCYKYDLIPDHQYILHINRKLHRQSIGSSVTQSITQKLLPVIEKLSALQSTDQEKGLKLICKIIQKILINQDNVKYQKLNVVALSKKLENCTLWFELLSLAGFEKSADGNWFILDNTKLQHLSYVNTVLLYHKWETNIQCICGKKMTKISTTKLYHGSGVVCDACRNNTKNDIIWHCDDEKNTIHKGGFDICLECSKQDCFGYIQNCFHFRRLSRIMYQYNQLETQDNDFNTADEYILEIVNNYLHLMDKHDQDEDFEYIVDRLGECDVLTCVMFRRNNRDRNGIINQCDAQKINLLNINDIVYGQIMDKIHCYFMHCYDIGNRLKIQDKYYLELDKKTESKQDDDDMLVLVNKTMRKMNTILSGKREIYTMIRKRLNNRPSHKFNQLVPVKNDKMYSFGYQFYYGDDDEHSKKSITVQRKYHSLKEELTSNEISIITLGQFRSEYKKAKIHFTSKFCKDYFRPYDEYYSRNCIFKMSTKYKTDGIDIKMEYLLALMIYCNHDQLQYNFSSTYRNHNGNEHDEFYWFGKNLKLVVHKFGITMTNSVDENFYHGISEKLLFPDYTGVVGLGVVVHSPLSTSTAFEVAANFANNNKGLIIQISKTTNFYFQKCKYFAVSWLSDYGNESECLFIQNDSDDFQTLIICNIFDPNSSIEYAGILQTLFCIDFYINTNHPSSSMDEMPRTNNIISLMKVIIENQLSYTSEQFEPFKSLTQYAKNMCNVYFAKQKSITIDYIKCNVKCPFVIQLFFHSNYEWINMDIINSLFPNITSISIKNVNLCSSTLNDILAQLSKRLLNVKEILIQSNEKCSLLSQEVVDKYNQTFNKMNVFISANIHRQLLYMNRCSASEFAIKLIAEGIGNRYFRDRHKKIESLINKLITTQLSKPKSTFPEELLDNYWIHIDWREIISNPNDVVKQIFYLEYGWINLEMMSKIFPNVDKLTMKNIRLCSLIFEDILIYLHNGKRLLQTIEIVLGSDMTTLAKSCPKEQLKDYSEYINVQQNKEDILIKLYEIRDNIEFGDDEVGKDVNIYNLEKLIISHVIFKYKVLFEEIGFEIDRDEQNARAINIKKCH
eukprot:360032_1